MRASSLAPVFMASMLALGSTATNADVRIGNAVIPGNNVQIRGPIIVQNGVVSNPSALPSGSYFVDPRTGARTPVHPAVPQVPQYPAYGTQQNQQSWGLEGRDYSADVLPQRQQTRPVEAPQYMAFRSKGREMYCRQSLLSASAGEVVGDYCPDLQEGTPYVRLQHPFVEAVELNSKTTAFCKRGKSNFKKGSKITFSSEIPEGGLDCIFAEWGTGPNPR